MVLRLQGRSDGSMINYEKKDPFLQILEPVRELRVGWAREPAQSEGAAEFLYSWVWHSASRTMS